MTVSRQADILAGAVDQAVAKVRMARDLAEACGAWSTEQDLFEIHVELLRLASGIRTKSRSKAVPRPLTLRLEPMPSEPPGSAPATA